MGGHGTSWERGFGPARTQGAIVDYALAFPESGVLTEVAMNGSRMGIKVLA